MSNTMFDALRKKHAALADAKTVDIPLPGYDSTLIARYRVLDIKTEINKISTRAAQETQDQMEQAMNAAVDAMITSCVELFTSNGNGEMVPLADFFRQDLSEEEAAEIPPVRYDHKLAEFMQWTDIGPEMGAREVVLRLFQGIEPMIINHSAILSNWMGDVTKRATDNFLRR